MSNGISLIRGFLIPLHRFHVILAHSLAFFITVAEIALRFGMALIRGFTIPLHRFCVILAYSSTVSVAIAKLVLSYGMALIRGFPIPLHRFCVILAYPLAIVIAITKISHTRHTAQFFRPFAEMFHRFLIIPRLRVIKVILTGSKIMPQHPPPSMAFSKRHFFNSVQFPFTAFVSYAGLSCYHGK